MPRVVCWPMLRRWVLAVANLERIEKIGHGPILHHGLSLQTCDRIGRGLAIRDQGVRVDRLDLDASRERRGDGRHRREHENERR